jgi:processing peptidase subunit beta
MPSYVTEKSAAKVTSLNNGVQVVSDFTVDGGSGPQYTTVRLSGVGSRFDKVGGEHALFAKSLGGSVGREHITLPGLTSLSNVTVAEDVFKTLKANQIASFANAASHDAHIMDRLHETAFQSSPSGNSLGNALEGSADSVESLSASSVSSLMGGLTGSNVVVVGTGSGNHDKLVEEADKALGSLKSGAGSKAVGAVGEKPYFIGSDIRIRYDSHSNATVAIAFEGASWTDPKAMPLALMTTLLGSYTKSEGIGKNVAASMCQEVALHNLASSISTFSLSYTDTGLFGFIATAPDNKLDDLMWYVLPNFVRLAHGFSDEEMARAKNALKANILASMDGDIALGEETARQIQTIGRVMPLAETLARVDALTMEDVKAAATEVINDQDHALAAIGGIHELPDYNWIRRHSYMLRY